MDKPKVIVICGPTASGKTALSIELAKKIDGEIISCDSMQIYKDMNIGTAKVTKSEMQGIKHYLVDFVSPDTRYSVADYKTDAEKAIENIISKGKIPIIVGGTGLYVDSLIYGIEYPEIKFDEEYRKKLEKEAEEGLENLYNKAKEIDEQAMQKISINDRKRIIRVLEIYHATGKNKTEQEKESRKKEVKYDYKIFAINIDREKLYERINIRVDKMIENMISSNPDFENAVQFLCLGHHAGHILLHLFRDRQLQHLFRRGVQILDGIQFFGSHHCLIQQQKCVFSGFVFCHNYLHIHFFTILARLQRFSHFCKKESCCRHFTAAFHPITLVSFGTSMYFNRIERNRI